jgi:hypothetical protein
VKALTITQPWATLIAIRAKRFETRGWQTPHRGPIAIHAGKGVKPVGGERGLRELCASQPFKAVLTLAGYEDPADLPRGEIVAAADLVGCFSTDEIAACASGLQVTRITGMHPCQHERAFGDYSPDRFAWVLGDVQPVTPGIEARGELGLWEWER